jgi:outer membrane receptor for ferrienterochelin and colicin
MRYFISFLLFITVSSNAQNPSIVLFGKVVNNETKEPLPGSSITILSIQEGTTTDLIGNYSLRIPVGEFQVKFSCVGFQSYTAKIKSSPGENAKLNVGLTPNAILQKEITIRGSAAKSSILVQKIEAKEISKIPTLYNDVIRSIQILAGVSTNNELSSGYNVRGGTYDENLIYLNGYEIYRPFLLRQGIEENQSLINPILVDNISFYNGAFPARFGDKTASVLEVNYETEFKRPLQVSAKVDLMNAGLALMGNTGNFNWSAAARISYPSLFLEKLQTRGDYKPSFSDFQYFANYSFSESSNLQLFLLYAVNDYDLTPTDWLGHFRSDRSTGFASQITLLYKGNRLNSYRTGLYSLRYRKILGDNTSLSFSYARYTTSEIEKTNITGDLYYSPNATDQENDKEYLFSKNEFADNSVALYSNEITTELKTNYKNHFIRTGASLKLVNLNSDVNENYSETGPQAVTTIPKFTMNKSYRRLNSFGFFTEDVFTLMGVLNMNIGIRYLYNSFTNENLISPRGNLLLKISEVSSLKFGWGYYYQPPFYNEINCLADKSIDLKSQIAIHYALGWEQQINTTMKINVEAYYKSLDKLIPFYYEDIKPVYLKGNVNEGYVYGLDAMLQGEFTEGIESRIGYSYLDSKEREKGLGKPYHRRLLDQTHTIQIYFQDRFPKHRNWQSHLRFLVGSGFLYAPNKIVKDEASGESVMITDIEHPEEIFLYFRVDMGLTAAFDLGANSRIQFVAEVLNLFNHYNVGSYDWLLVFKDFHQVIPIPKVLSKRFYNIRMEITL